MTPSDQTSVRRSSRIALGEELLGRHVGRRPEEVAGLRERRELLVLEVGRGRSP